MERTQTWEVIETPQKGRCLIAKQDFKENDIILVEKPYLCYQLSENVSHLLVCQNCLSPVGSLASQLVRQSQYDHLLNEMIHFSLYNEIKNLGKQKLPLIDEEQSLFSKDTCECQVCGGGCYCSQVCKEQDWKGFHTILCNKYDLGFREFCDHAHENQEVFYLACKTILRLSILIKQNKKSEAQEFKDNVDSLCHDFSWNIIAVPDGVLVKQHDVYRVMLKEMVQESLKLLLNLMKNLKIIENNQKIPELLQSWVTLDGYGRLLGSFIQNALCISYPNPVVEYLNLLKENWDVEIEEQWQNCFNFWYQKCKKKEEEEESAEKSSSEDDESSEDSGEIYNRNNICCKINNNNDGCNNNGNKVSYKQPLKINTDLINKEDDYNNTVINIYNHDIEQVIETCAQNLEPFQGSGIFKIISNINHSCKPNAGVQILNWNMEASLVALQSIGKGEEIFISYIDNCEEGYESRQKELQEYKFVCDCEKCELDRQKISKKRKIKK